MAAGVAAMLLWLLIEAFVGSARDGGDPNQGIVTQEHEISSDERDPPQIERESEAATFRIDTIPPGATVRLLDGTQAYRPDMVLPIGNYRVWVSAPGYRTKVETIRHRWLPTAARVELQRIETARDADPDPSGGIGSGRGSGVGPGSGGVGGGVFRIDAGVTSPRLVSKVAPEYSEEAREAKMQGTVMLAVEVWRTALRTTSASSGALASVSMRRPSRLCASGAFCLGRRMASPCASPLRFRSLSDWPPKSRSLRPMSVIHRR